MASLGAVEDARGLIFDIHRYSVHDGPGIRTTLFFKGCPLSCWWCHNPESQGRAPFLHYDPGRCLRCGACIEACPEGALAFVAGAAVSDPPGADGVELDPGRCRLDDGCPGRCVDACPAEARQRVGRWLTVAEVVDAVDRDALFHEQSGGGVTFSGGEPLLQWRFLSKVLDACGERGIHRAVDTTGFASPDVLLRVAERTDLFLYDIKTLDPGLHRRATGVPLQPILDNLARLLDVGARVRIRVPLIPGVSDGDAAADALALHLRGLGAGRLDGVHLLPFHRPAKAKHERFGLPWRLPVDTAVPEARVLELGARLERQGVHVTIGG